MTVKRHCLDLQCHPLRHVNPVLSPCHLPSPVVLLSVRLTHVIVLNKKGDKVDMLKDFKKDDKLSLKGGCALNYECDGS